MVARSMLSAEGSQRSSPRRAAAVSLSPMAALISPRCAATGVAVQGAHELEGEVVGAVERALVDALRNVLGAVVVGGKQRAIVQAGDGGRAELRQAGGKGVGGECLAQ